MQCKTHPGTPAQDRCAGCAETFCEICLVPVQGQRYCASCKVMALGGRTPAILEERTVLCEDSRNALIWAAISLFICTPILGIVAIVKANNAKQLIARNPSLTGKNMATAAQVVAVVYLIFWVIGKIAMASRLGGH